MTLYAQWSRNNSGCSTTRYTLSYESTGGTEYADERYAEGRTVTLDKMPTREGYAFTGWYADEDLTEKITSIKMDGDETIYAGWRAAAVPDMLNGTTTSPMSSDMRTDMFTLPPTSAAPKRRPSSSP